MKGFFGLLRATASAIGHIHGQQGAMATHNHGPVGPRSLRCGVAAAKRAAKKRRNQLRAKGRRSC